MNELAEFCLDVENGQKNYNLAEWYENEGHNAAAHTYYLRAAERTEDKLLAYKALIRASFCYKKQGSRDSTEKILLENALITLPSRPEAHYFLSLLYEKKGEWQNCYIHSTLGLNYYQNSTESIEIPEYSGKHLLIFQKAVSSWHWGKGKESRELFQLLSDEYYDLMDDRHQKLIDENMIRFGLSKNKHKIIDSFIFFNEFDILKLRLNYLNDVVDHFVICESNYTHSGNPKPYYLDEIWNDIPEQIQNKIVRLKYEPDISQFNFPNNVTEYNPDNDHWKFENEHRNYINTCLNQFSTTDVFILSDVDEIPNKNVIQNFITFSLNVNFEYVLKYDMFYYNFNTVVSNYSWFGSYVTTVSNVIEKGCNFMRSERINYNQLNSAGWHFSCFGNVNQIATKLNSYAHQEYNKKEYTSNILNRIQNKQDLFGREDVELEDYNFTDLPEDLTNNITQIYSSEFYDTNKKRIIDCFRFYNEKELLELRYHVLKDYVDKFVILEGTRTQSGILRDELLAKKYIKELNLPEDKFIVIEKNLPGNDEEIENNDIDIIFRSRSANSNDTYKNSLNARTRERLLLDELLTVIPQFSDNDVFMVSDCDEIIRPEFIDYFSDMVKLNQDKLIKIPLVELQGKANLRAYNVYTNTPVSTDNVFFMCTKKHFDIATPTQLRFDINNSFEVVYITQDEKRIEDCGWHFSWIGDSDRLKLKQKSTSHYADQIESAVIQDMNSEEVQTLIENWRPSDNGINAWGDKTIVLKNYSEVNLPPVLFKFENLKKFFLLESKIPVLGVPIVNGVHWLKRLIDSIDYPVKELFIVNNNGRDQITNELDELTKISHPFVDKIRVCHLPHNLGVSGAWNLIIKSYLISPYWIICNNDVAFTPGFLKEMTEKASDSNTKIVWPPSINSSYSACNLGSFECFLLKSSVVEKCGLFDENLYPAYCEDCDYLAKIKCNNISSQFVYSPYYHGESQSYETGSQTLKMESPEVSQKIHQFHMLNREYMNDVWGEDWENWESYSNKISSFKSYDLSFTKKKYLGF